MKVFKNTRRHMCARKLARLPQDILKVADRLSLVVLATAYPQMDFLLPKCASCIIVSNHEERCESNESLASAARSAHFKACHHPS